MRFMVIVKASKDSEAGKMPDQRLLADMGDYNEELVKAGVMLAGEGLAASSKGARIHFKGRERKVVHGPFTQTSDLVAGFWIWKCKDLAEAIEWLKKCPNPNDEETNVEIRQISEMEDFGEAFTPELREQEQRVLEAAKKNA